MRWPHWHERRYLEAVGLLTIVCLGLFLFRGILSGHLEYAFIPGNLFLAWLALVFAWLLTLQLRIRPWSSWQNIGLTLMWLILLPNTWYVLTDFIHIEPVESTAEVSLLYDVVLINSLVFTGFILGCSSLYLIHKEFFKRVGESASNLLATGVILVASFGIYLGRDIRWNTWDVIANPGGVAVTVSDRILDPFGYPRALNVTLLFFLIITATYFTMWIGLRSLATAKREK